MYMLEAACTSGSRCWLLYEEMSSSTLPSSRSITPRRSLMNIDVLIAIWFRSFTQFSL